MGQTTVLADFRQTIGGVRLIDQERDKQTQVVARLLSKYARKPEAICDGITVILELGWVLRSRYKFSKTDLVIALSSLLMADVPARADGARLLEASQ